MSVEERDQFLEQQEKGKKKTPGDVVCRPSFDDVLEKLGNPGRFQLFQIALMFHSQLFMAFMSMSFVFLGHEPAHVCSQQGVNETSLLEQHGLLNDSTATVSYRSCDLLISSNQTGRHTDLLTTSCPQGRNFSHKKHTTWLSHWDLVCESGGQAELTFTGYNTGFVIGGLIAPFLADRYGRRIVFLAGFFLSFSWEFLVLFAPSIYFIVACRFLLGLSRPGISSTYFVFVSELVVPRHREYCGILVCVLWVAQMLVLASVAFIFQDNDWRYVQGASAVAGAFCLVYPFILYESPRWLNAKNRHKEALAVLEKAAKQSGKDFEEIKDLYLRSIVGKVQDEDLQTECEMRSINDCSDSGSVEVKTVEENVSILTLLRHCDLLVLTVSAVFIWFTHNLTYYGLYLTSSSLAGNRFVNFCLMALVEIPSNIFILYMMKRMKRLLVLRIFMILAGLALFGSTLVVTFGEDWSASGAVMTVLFIFGKLTITSSYNVLFVITPEIFPTNLRTTGFATCNCFSRVGSAIAPFFRPLIKEVKWGPGAIFTVLIIVALILTRFYPETKDKELCDTVEDFRKTLKQNKRKGNQTTKSVAL